MVDFGDEGTTSSSKSEPVVFDSDTIAGIAIAAVESYIIQEKRAARLEELAPARAAVRALSLSHARKQLEKIGS